MNKDDMQLLLLDEINEICRENDLTYVLYGYSLKSLKTTGKITGNDHIITIGMVQGEAEIMFQKLKKTMNIDRFVQYSSVNDTSFIYWGGNYGWSGTTCFNINADTTGSYNGIRINVQYFETISENKENIELANRYFRLRKMKNAKANGTAVFNRYRTRTRIAALLNSNKQLTRKYYHERSKNKIEKWNELEKYNNVKIENNIVNTQSFNKPLNVNVNGLLLMIPNDTNAFLASLHLPRIVALKKRGQIVDETLDYFDVVEALRERGIVGKAIDYQAEINKIRSEVKKERKKLDQLEKKVNEIVES